MTFTLSKNIKSPTAFLAQFSELTDRLDPEMVLFRRRTHDFRYPPRKLREFLSAPPQYGAGERGLERTTFDQPRYVRITDISDEGILSAELGATAAKVEAQYLLRDGDLLFARSGNTVGKAYIHKAAEVPYPCFFAGYLIRFRFRTEEFLPEYAFAISQLPYFKQWVQAVQRAAGQPNINAQEYGNLEVPSAPLRVQRRVVSLLQDAYDDKRRHDTEAHALLNSIDDLLLHELGIKKTKSPSNPLESLRFFQVPSTEVSGQRWDPNYSVNMKRFMTKIGSCKYPIQKLRNSLAMVQYGISELATDERIGVPMLRMLNLQDGEWSLSDLKYINMNEAKSRPYLLKKDDILFNRTNSKELVGKCNVFDMDEPFVFASYLMRVRLRPNAELLPGFVVAYMASSLGRIQIDAVSRQIAGMTNINAEEVRELLVPIPPKSVQAHICKQIDTIRQQARQLRVQSGARLLSAKNQIETLVFGKEAAV